MNFIESFLRKRFPHFDETPEEPEGVVPAYYRRFSLARARRGRRLTLTMRRVRRGWRLSGLSFRPVDNWAKRTVYAMPGLASVGATPGRELDDDSDDSGDYRSEL